MPVFGRGYPMMSAMHHPPPRLIPVAFDAAGAGQAGHVTSLSWSHAISSGATAVLVFMNQGSTTAPTVTVGGASMTLLASILNYATASTSAFAFGLLSAPTGSQTVAISMAGTLFSAGNSVSYKNVASFGPVATTNSSGTALTQSVTAGHPPQMIVQSFQGFQQALSSYNQTQRSSLAWVSGSSGAPMLIGDAPSGSVTFSATGSASQAWASIAVPLN